MYRKTILATALLFLAGPTWAAGSHKQSVDPFTGTSQKYEQITQQALAAQAEQKLVQSQYQIARYRRKLAQLSGHNPNSGSRQSKVSKLEQQVQQLSAQMMRLAQTKQLGPSQSEGIAAKGTAPPPAQFKLVGIAQAGSDRTAWLKLPSGKVRRVKAGSRLHGITVKSVDARSIVLLAHGNTQRLVMNRSYGQISITGKVANVAHNRGGFGGFPTAAPGSTPASAAQLKRQGASAIASALQGG